MGCIASRRDHVVRAHYASNFSSFCRPSGTDAPRSSSADPTFSTIPELVENLRDADADLIVVHPDFLDKIAGVAEAAGISPERILLLDKPHSLSGAVPYPVLWELVSDLDDGHEHFTERKLAGGSARSKPAFYVISHGLSGMPKV